MMGAGVAKKELARRTGLSVPTVRKYLKMIEEGVGTVDVPVVSVTV